jgi:hypothetical protein
VVIVFRLVQKIKIKILVEYQRYYVAIKIDARSISIVLTHV